MKIQETLVEGRTKKLSRTDQDEQLIMEFLDAVPFQSTKNRSVKGKGAINSSISAYLFEYLGSYNVPTHFIKRVNDKKILVKKLEMFPLKVTVWNIASNSLAKKIGLKDGTMLDTPVMELYLKNSKLKDPLINDYHAYALNICNRNEMSAISRISTKINAVLKSYFQRKKLYLANFTLEFGKFGNQVLLGDEISPDTFRVWEILEGDKLDKKTYVIDENKVKQVYSKLRELLL